MITNDLLQAAATRLKCDLPAVQAVSSVEAGGQTEWNINGMIAPPIRLEAHWFGKLTHYKYNTSHPNISSMAWNPVLAARTRNGAWAQFQEAYALDPNAAIEACSWGAFQIMGFHWSDLGYESAEDFRGKMSTAEGQLDAFVRYIEKNNLSSALRNHQWEVFAAGYNGSGAVAEYAGKMMDAFESYGGQP